MTNLDHGKFTRVTTTFHSLLALDVFLLFFTGYAIMFNDQLWWLVTLLGGATGVTALHRVAGFGLLVLVIFWFVLQIISPTGRSNFGTVIPDKDDIDAFVQDVQFMLGRADERHPNARQFAGYKSDEVPLLSYIGKGVVWIFSIELLLLTISGLLIWNKTGMMSLFNTKPAVMAFVTFHGLLGVIMLMGVMFHVFEHGMHPAFYPVETKAFIPKRLVPEHHGEEEPEGTGIEKLSLSPSWRTVSSLMGVLTVVGITSVMIGSLVAEGYPIPRELAVQPADPFGILLTIGINVGILVLGIGIVLSTYGNLLRLRWERQLEQEQRAAADGGTSTREADD